MKKSMKQEINPANPYRITRVKLRRTLVVVGFFSAAVNLLMLTGPIYMLQVYDRVLSSGSIATLQGLFIIVVILYSFLGIYDFLRARLLSRASYRIDKLVGEGAFNYWLLSGIHEDENRYNPVRDLEIVRGFLASPAILGLFDLPWIPIFLAVVFLIHPWLGYLTVAGAGVVVVAAISNWVMTRRTIAQAMSKDSGERSFVELSRRNAEAILALGMKTRITNKWLKIHETSLADSQIGSDRSEVFTSFSKAFRLLLQSGLLTVGAYLALAQEISAGMIIAASIIAGRALAPIDQVIGQWRAIGRAGEANKRLLAALDNVPPEKQRVKLPPLKGNIKVTNLTKIAPAHNQTVERKRLLDQVSFELEAGDGLGVIGSSAAGKSTLAKLLVGVWQPDLGDVRLDGATLDQWRPEDLGRYIGYLPQTVAMLPGTIAENIARFDPEANDADIIEAARTAGVHEMILAMPEGYSTYIGTMAQSLSGGQNQRLGLARAIYGMPRFLVLDEPNSNLDKTGDEALTKAITKLRAQGSTVIVMAHRPSVIQAVNKVMILHKGRMATFGDKDEVIRASASKPDAPKVTGE